MTYDDGFEKNIDKYLDGLAEQADYYVKISDQLENDPLLAIDYLRRAYLITKDSNLQARAKEHFDHASLQTRAKSSVEMLLIHFAFSNTS